MKPENFIKKVIIAYQKARLSSIKNKKIRRGRSHTISSVLEDLFAEYLISNDSTIDTLYVDQPISAAGKAFYPDISVEKGGELIAFFDLKADLGWNRVGLPKLAKEHTETIHSANDKEASLWEKIDSKTKIRKKVKIAKNVTYSIVVLSGENINNTKLKEQLKTIKQYAPRVEAFILTAGEHPNEYGMSPSEVLKKISIIDTSFDSLLKKLTF